MTKHIGNLAAFDLLVDTIRNIDNSPTSKRGFDMILNAFYENETEHPCGTACCIGGWAAVLTDKHSNDPDTALANMVGISLTDAHAICYPPDTRDIDAHPGWSATPEHAVSLLLHYRKTGVVDWDRAMELDQ